MSCAQVGGGQPSNTNNAGTDKGNDEWYKLDVPKPLDLSSHREQVVNVNSSTTIKPIVPISERRRLNK